MSIALAIDTSTSRTSVAIVDEGAILWHGYRDGATSHGDALPALVAEGLKVSPEISRVVVGMGPGPYTGLRVGIAFARSFALARSLPVLGVCSLDAIAATVREEFDFIVATDARRKEIYWAKYISSERVEGPLVDFPAHLAGFGLPIFGEGGVKYGISSSDENLYPDMVALVALSAHESSHISEPLYLRRPDAVPTNERTS
jgi:tRNA threonylcarbamoyl adenosine modification protein YeaZ